MKNLLRLIVVVLGCQITSVYADKFIGPCKDGGVTWSLTFDKDGESIICGITKDEWEQKRKQWRQERLLENRKKRQESLLENRKKYAAIKLNGGIIRRVGSDQIVGCKTPRDHEEHMNFIYAGDGKPSDFCWPIKEGTGVKLASAYSAEFPQCTEEFKMCRFDPGWFGKSFYTLFINVEPVE